MEQREALCFLAGAESWQQGFWRKNPQQQDQTDNQCAAAALRMAAFTLSNSKSALGPITEDEVKTWCTEVTATAHKLARLIYSMLRHGRDMRPGAGLL